jgi:putative ABC transport system permease protein
MDMETFFQDIRYALRMLARSRGFTVVAALTLALGIGANTAIFSVIQAVLLRPLPYTNSQQLMAVTGANQERNLRGVLLSYTKFSRLQETTRAFETLGAFFSVTTSMTTKGVPEELDAAHATGNFFGILGVSVAQGRGFRPEENEPGGADVALVSNGFWQSHLGGRPEAVGQAIALDGRSVTIVGVLPASFRFPLLDPEPDVWFPRIIEYPALDQVRIHSGAGYMIIVGRLRPNETMAHAQAEFDAINEGYKRDFPAYADAGKSTLEIQSLEETLVGTLRPSLLVLLVAVGFVLLIGCANVASLVLSRTTARRKEIAVRRALGASRARLVRQLLTESVVLSLGGGALGILLASWGLGLLRYLPAGTLPSVGEIRVDTGVLFFTVALCVLTGVGVGLLPALQASRKDLQGTLKDGGRGTTPGEGGRMRAALVVAEVAVAVMLLTGASLLIRSFTSLLRIDPGFQPGNVTVFSMNLPQARYAESVQRATFYHELVERAGTLPGVQSAAAISHLPLGTPPRFVFFCPEGTVCQGLGKDPLVAVRQITPDYFKVMQIPVLRGRPFAESDAAQTLRVVIVNQTIAKRYFPGQDPIGKHLANSRDMIPLEIVGVVGDVKFSALSQVDTEEMYIPQAQDPFAAMNLVVRSTSGQQALTSAVRKEMAALDADLPITRVSRMEEIVSTSVAQPRLTSECAGAFATLAMVLALVGIYGVMAYSVAQRIPELGLRLALGAQPSDVLRLVLGQGARLVLGGVALGLAGSFALTWLLSSLLFGTSAQDPLTFGGVAVMLTGVAMLACVIPACRAMRVDPIVALRYE